MRVVVSGASGLIGSALVRVLRDDGHQVLRLVRREKRADDELSWDPAAGRGPEASALDGVDAVVNLAGAGIGDHRWTDAYKQQIVASRVESTTLLAAAVAAADHLPRVFISASGVDYYGNPGDVELDEDSPAGSTFLADVCQQWEAATQEASAAGVRTVVVRSGIVLSTRGGALARVLPLFKAGVGGRLGSGEQYVSWIARPDHIAALRFLLDADDVSGPVNLTSPEPVTNETYTKEIAAAVRRPALFAVPSPALKLVIGPFAQTVLAGQRVLPRRLFDAGFAFDYPTLRPALRTLLDSDA